MASHGADHQPDQGSDQQADRESDRWPAQRVGRTVDPDASAAPDQGTDSLVEDGAGQPAVGAAGSAATAMSQAVRDGLAGTGEATDSAGSGGLAVSQATGAGVAVGGLPADDAVIGGGAAGEVAGRDPQVGAETAKQVVAGKAVADGATDGLVAADVMTSNVVDDVADHETADHETADHETADHELTANEPAAKAVTNDEVATNEAASKAVASAIAARRAVDDAEAAANIGDDVAAAEEMGGGVVADKGVEDVAAGGLAAGVDDQRNNADTAVEDAEGGGVDGSEPVGNHSDRHPNHITTQAVLAEAKDAMHRPDFRRAIVCGVIALAAPGVVLWLKTIRATHLSAQIAWYACIGACALFGVIAVRSAANEVGRMVRPRGGPGVAGVLRLLITLAGYIAVLATVLDMLGVQLGNLLLSGAITGVIVGIAAQQSLGNAFAGLVLLFSRPFAVGDTITVSSGALGGEHRGEVVAITMMFTVLETKDGPLSLPNSGVLAAATSRRTTKTR
jgi:hypothetical protein